jgi:hypothetical protein
MSEINDRELVFVVIGTENYHFMINKNIELLRRLYPHSPVLVYDWGDGNGNPSATKFPAGVEVVNWRERIMDTWPLMDVYSPARRNEIGRTFNSRMQKSFSRRLNKFVLKRFPNSAIANAAIERGLRYENMLLHKSYNLQECSRHLQGVQFFLLDADAYMVERIDEVFEGNPDVILPMIDPSIHNWDYNDCHGLSTGVVGFGSNVKARDAFLMSWYAAIKTNDEWLRELAAMNRMIREQSEEFFDTLGDWDLAFGGETVRIRKIENDVYNCYFNYQDTPPDMDRAKILHLSGVAQRPHLFQRYIDDVESELSKRGAAA